MINEILGVFLHFIRVNIVRFGGEVCAIDHTSSNDDFRHCFLAVIAQLRAEEGFLASRLSRPAVFLFWHRHSLVAPTWMLG